jgi:hypothetical protein
MTVSDVQHSIRRTRALRVAAFLAAALNALMLAVNVAGGSLLGLILAPFSGAAVIALLALIVAQTRMIGTFRRRERELSRPRMTPEDYRRLREMEIELGWEPSDPPADAEAPVTASPRQARVDGGGCRCLECRRRQNEARMRALIIAPKPDLGNPQADRDMRDLRELEANSAGSPSAPMTGPGGRWHPVSELSERDAMAADVRPGRCRPAGGFATQADLSHMAEWLAAEAKAGRGPSYCPVCADRDAGPETMRQWLEDGRWEQ